MAKRRLERSTASLTAEVATVTKEAAKLLGTLTETAKVKEAKASALAEKLALTEEELEAKKLVTAEVIKKNKALVARCDELEYALTELEDQMEAKNFDNAVLGLERARAAQNDVDGDYDEEKPKSGPARKHTFEVRVAISSLLALGINPSAVIPALQVTNFLFPGGVPRLDFVRKMRRELRIMVLALAAATAADPAVSLDLFSLCYLCMNSSKKYSFYVSRVRFFFFFQTVYLIAFN